MIKHEKTAHQKSIVTHIYTCGMCKFGSSSPVEIKQHRQAHLNQSNFGGGGEVNVGASTSGEQSRHKMENFILVQSAHNRKCEIFRFIFPEEVVFSTQAHEMIVPKLVEFLQRKLEEHKLMKVMIVLNLEMIQVGEDGEPENVIHVPFRATMMKIMPLRTIAPLLENAFMEIEHTIDEFLHRGSGWIVNDVLFLDVEIVECRALAGG